jgi:L-ascorbate metabolism protein UlaG (beta-lactamase superfamily)
MSVQLEFVGHACFRLWEDGKPTIVMDPYAHKETQLEDDGSRLDAETVIVSSLTDAAHSNVGFVRGNPRVINALDVATGVTPATINGSPLVTIAAAEYPDHDIHAPMDNALYAFKAGDLWFAHLGDLGYGLSEEELAPWVGKCDVLMPIVGEKNTVKLDELDPMIEFLKPTWIVPMHYALPPLGGADAGGMTFVDAFLNRHPRSPVYIARHHTVTFPLPKSEDGRPTIVVLEPSGYKPAGGLPEFQSS